MATLVLVHCPSCGAGFKYPASVAPRVDVRHVSARVHIRKVDRV